MLCGSGQQAKINDREEGLSVKKLYITSLAKKWDIKNKTVVHYWSIVIRSVILSFDKE